MKVLIFNANGSIKDKTQFADYLHTQGIDIALISETHLLPSHKYSIANYEVYRTDRGTEARGGSAIIIRSSIPHVAAPFVTSPSFETVAIKIVRSRAECLKFIATYKTPKIVLNSEDLDRIFFEDVPTILGGDLNAKHTIWHSSVANPCGRLLADYAEEHDLLVVGPCGHPSPLPTGRRICKDVLDIAVLRDTSVCFNMYSTVALDSDHLPVILELDGIDINRNCRACSVTNWDLVTDTLRHMDTDFTPPPSIASGN